jgi:hypothetical protein
MSTWCLIVASLWGADAVNEPPQWTLFDGQSLAGWVVENDAEVDVVDGALRLKSGMGWVRSASEYRDFDLHVECMALQTEKYDAGIYLRAGKEGKPFPQRGRQINLLQGHEGNLVGHRDGVSRGLALPAGQWNVFDISVRGDRVKTTINGQVAYDVIGLGTEQGYLGFQVEVPQGGQFLIRNVRVVEVGFESLFNGTDLTGWDGADGPAADCWTVDAGDLVCTGQKGPWLRSAQEYGDFNLRLEYLVSTGGNSGVYVRVPFDGNHHRDNDTQPPAGFEVQILDDAAPQYATLKDYQYSASVYDLCGAAPRVCRPAGEWNTLEINAIGQHITTWHNGQRVTDVTVESAPMLALRQTKGYLGLQNHSTMVRFRHVRIGPALDPLASAPAKAPAK